jgi:hypothetical protein
MCMYVCVCTYAYINMQIHTNSYRIRIRSRIRIRIRDRIRNSLKSRIRIRDRIRKKSFRIHNTAWTHTHCTTQRSPILHSALETELYGNGIQYNSSKQCCGTGTVTFRVVEPEPEQ